MAKKQKKRKQGLWDNIHAKRARIKAGRGTTKMRRVAIRKSGNTNDNNTARVVVVVLVLLTSFSRHIALCSVQLSRVVA